MADFEIRAKFALLEDFDFYENVIIEVKDGIIKKISHGNQGIFPPLILIPPLVNSHVHTGDSAFPDLGSNLYLEDLVKPNTGLKHKFLEKVDKKILKETRIKWIKNIRRFGSLIIADFVEGGYKMLSETTYKVFKEYLIYGRPLKQNIEEEIEKLYKHSDGLGIPDSFTYSKDEMKVIKERFKDKPIHIHVSESKENYEKKDFWIALEYLDPKAFVHCTYLKREEIKEIKRMNKFVIICPRSNMWFGSGFPDLKMLIEEEVNVAIGTDNVGWVNPNIWRDLELIILNLRLKRESFKLKEIFKWATYYGFNLFNIQGGIIKERFPATFLLINNEHIELEKSHDKLLTLIKRFEKDFIIGIYIKGVLFNFHD